MTVNVEIAEPRQWLRYEPETGKIPWAKHKPNLPREACTEAIAVRSRFVKEIHPEFARIA